jgi:RNA polymerase sigma-54 factor
MKPSIQLRLGTHLTMTPQLQQAIRLLQLSTLDLKQEIQDALESNLMLETEEEGVRRDEAAEDGRTAEEGANNGAESGANGSNDPNNESEIQIESQVMPDELPVDTVWDDIYDSVAPVGAAASGEDGQDFLSQQSSAESLQDYLLWQMRLSRFSPTDLAIAEAIIDGINDDGYLTTPLEDIIASMADEDVELAEVEAVLHRVQAFDPPGIAARDLRECLLIQLRQLPAEDCAWRETALQLVGEHFESLAQQDEQQMRRRLKLESDELAAVIHLIRSLNPRPGTSVSSQAPSYIEPDVFVYKHNNQWRVELNPEAAPRLRVNAEYANLIRRADNSADNVTMKNHLQEARWFIKSLQSRNDTLLRVATRIVEVQRNFFDFGEEHFGHAVSAGGLDRFAMAVAAVALDLLLVAQDLAIKLVDQRINGGVHILVFGIGEHVGAGDVDGGFGLLALFLDAEDHVNVGHMIEMPLQADDFFVNVGTH